MKNKQIFFVILFLIFTCFNALKLRKNNNKNKNDFVDNLLNKSEKQKQEQLNQLSNNIDGFIAKAKVDMKDLIKEAKRKALKEIKEEEENKK
jgi:F0F1-type ATP synthase membrane subunit b/b'